ncbi:hypothetical protein NXC14_PC00791 (plasmid) [Rhizobium sp. NXC14]|nr:hypothetical protein NXC14_PC00791 [Rhizobium sp. NXC14]
MKEISLYVPAFRREVPAESAGRVDQVLEPDGTRPRNRLCLRFDEPKSLKKEKKHVGHFISAD